MLYLNLNLNSLLVKRQIDNPSPFDSVSGSRYITALKGPLFLFSFAITAAGVVMCVGRKKSPNIIHKCRLFFLFGHLRLAMILRNQTLMIGLPNELIISIDMLRFFLN